MGYSQFPQFFPHTGCVKRKESAVFYLLALEAYTALWKKAYLPSLT